MVSKISGTILDEKSNNHMHILGDAVQVGNLKKVGWSAYDPAFSI
jgi:hypothetical protein